MMDLFQQTLLFKIANTLEEDNVESFAPSFHDPFEEMTEEEKSDLADQANVRRWGYKTDRELGDLILLGWAREITILARDPNTPHKKKVELAFEQRKNRQPPSIKIHRITDGFKLTINGEEIASANTYRQLLLRAVAAFWT